MGAHFQPFEMARQHDRALREVGGPELEGNDAVVAYAAELLRSVIDGSLDLFVALNEVHVLYRAAGDFPELRDFSLLYHTHGDLFGSDRQEAWPGATRENIVAIIRQRAHDFVRNNDSLHR